MQSEVRSTPSSVFCTLPSSATRAWVRYIFIGDDIGVNLDVLAENSWPLGQALHFVLLFLPVLSMAQVCLDEKSWA